MLLECIHSCSYLRSVANQVPYLLEASVLRYEYSSTIFHIVHGVRYRPYSYDTYHRYILRILVSLIPAAFHGHTLTGMRVPVLQNEDSSYSRLYVRECNTSNTGTTPITRMFALLLPWILLVLEALQSHTGILALVRRRALSLETHVSVLA